MNKKAESKLVVVVVEVVVVVVVVVLAVVIVYLSLSSDPLTAGGTKAVVCTIIFVELYVCMYVCMYVCNNVHTHTFIRVRSNLHKQATAEMNHSNKNILFRKGSEM